MVEGPVLLILSPEKQSLSVAVFPSSVIEEIVKEILYLLFAFSFYLIL